MHSCITKNDVTVVTVSTTNPGKTTDPIIEVKLIQNTEIIWSSNLEYTEEN